MRRYAQALISDKHYNQMVKDEGLLVVWESMAEEMGVENPDWRFFELITERRGKSGDGCWICKMFWYEPNDGELFTIESKENS